MRDSERPVERAEADPVEMSSLVRRLGGDAGIADKVLRVFREDAERQVAALQASDSGDADDIRAKGHKLKGSARNASATALASIAELIEKSATGLTPERWAALRSDLDGAWRVTKEWLNRRLGGNA